MMTDLQLKNEALQVQLDEEVANQKEIKTKLVFLCILTHWDHVNCTHPGLSCKHLDT